MRDLDMRMALLMDNWVCWTVQLALYNLHFLCFD